MSSSHDRVPSVQGFGPGVLAQWDQRHALAIDDLREIEGFFYLAVPSGEGIEAHIAFRNLPLDPLDARAQMLVVLEMISDNIDEVTRRVREGDM